MNLPFTFFTINTDDLNLVGISKKTEDNSFSVTFFFFFFFLRTIQVLFLILNSLERNKEKKKGKRERKFRQRRFITLTYLCNLMLCVMAWKKNGYMFLISDPNIDFEGLL